MIFAMLVCVALASQGDPTPELTSNRTKEAKLMTKDPTQKINWVDAGKSLFVPSHYAETDKARMLELLHDNPIVQLITHDTKGVRISAVPVLLEKDTPTELVFIGHLAARNAQADVVTGGAEATLLYSSPGAYISSQWFVSGVTAPTWSYLSLQLRGRVVPIVDPARKLEVLSRTVARMEGRIGNSQSQPWTLDKLSQEQRDNYLPNIVAFEFVVEDWEGIRRLNQEKTLEDLESIHEGLAQQDDIGSLYINRLIQGEIERRRN